MSGRSSRENVARTVSARRSASSCTNNLSLRFPKTPPYQPLDSNDYGDGHVTKKIRMDLPKVPCTKNPKTLPCQQHDLCFQEEVPVDEKIPHRLNTGCRHRGNLFEPVREGSESDSSGKDG